MFGRNGEPAHRYTMRQAIEEEFILDVLKNYTTYKTYYGLLKACNDDPNVERKEAAKALSRFLLLHPHNIAQKTRIMVEHFQNATRHRIGGRAKAMVATGSRLAAIRYKQSFDDYIRRKRYDIRTLVAFSGTVHDDKLPDVTFTEERYATCVPLVPLKAAAGAFGEPQIIADDGDFEWVAVESRRHLAHGMFVAQVVGKSMEPVIPDGSWCLFRAPVEGTRQGKTVLVQLHDSVDPETGQRYTVKRYGSQKAQAGDSWQHTRITLRPANPDYEPIVLIDTGEATLKVIAELLEVLPSNP